MPILFERTVNADGSEVEITRERTSFQLTCASVGSAAGASGSACGFADNDGMLYSLCPANADCVNVGALRLKVTAADVLVSRDVDDSAFVCIGDADYTANRKSDKPHIVDDDMFEYPTGNISAITHEVCVVDGAGQLTSVSKRIAAPAAALGARSRMGASQVGPNTSFITY